MIKFVLGWVQASADQGYLAQPGGPAAFAFRLSLLVVVAAELANVGVHLILDAAGMLPYTLAQALAVGMSVTFIVAGLVSFLVLLIIGKAVAALAINRDTFRRLSATDELSGLMNRRAFFQAMQDEAEAPLVLFDIDHFKALNDHYGHATGDAAIREISRRFVKDWQGTLPYVGRLGGEEFGLLLPGRTFGEAISVAETLRSRISDHPFSIERLSIPVTISGGVAAPLPHEGPDDLFRRCDAALYDAKREGRNRIAIASQQWLEPLCMTA